MEVVVVDEGDERTTMSSSISSLSGTRYPDEGRFGSRTRGIIEAEAPEKAEDGRSIIDSGGETYTEDVVVGWDGGVAVAAVAGLVYFSFCRDALN